MKNVFRAWCVVATVIIIAIDHSDHIIAAVGRIVNTLRSRKD